MRGEHGGIWHWTRVKLRWNREFWTLLLLGRTFPLRETPSVHVWKYFPHSSLVNHATSSASPVRMFLSDTKIKTVNISPFCFHTVLHWKICCGFFKFLFFVVVIIPDVFFVDPERVSICSYMCWASIMSKYLASMIWGSTLFLNTEQTEICVSC